jgi:hypothetical protein
MPDSIIERAKSCLVWVQRSSLEHSLCGAGEKPLRYQANSDDDQANRKQGQICPPKLAKRREQRKDAKECRESIDA